MQNQNNLPQEDEANQPIAAPRPQRRDLETVDLEKLNKKPPNPHPTLTQNFFLRFILFWIGGIIKKGNKETWSQDMNYDLPPYDQATSHKDAITRSLKENPNFVWAILPCYKVEIFYLVVAQIIRTVTQNLSNITKAAALSALSTYNFYHNEELALKNALLLVGSSVLIVLSDQVAIYSQFYATRISLNVRASMLTILQEKILKFGLLNSSCISQGLIADLIEVDVDNLTNFFSKVDRVFEGTIGLTVSLFFFCPAFTLTENALFLGSLVVIQILQAIQKKVNAWINKKYLAAKDKRMSLLRNVLDTTDYVKINGLENYFCLEMWERRQNELYWLKFQAWAGFVYGFVVGFPKFNLTFFVFVVYWIKTGAPGMNLDKYFRFNSYQGTFRVIFRRLINSYSYYLNLMVSVGRWNQFLRSQGKEINYVIDTDLDGVSGGKSNEFDNFSLRVVNGTFKWRYTESEEMGDLNTTKKKRRRATFGIDSGRNTDVGEQSVGLLTNTIDTQSQDGDRLTPIEHDEGGKDAGNNFWLRNINLAIRKGEKIAVIGPSSSGMSSLLYAIIGEMIPVTDAKVYTSGDLAYLPQSRWLMPSSVRENIVMGKEYDEELMRFSLEAADLIQDLDQFNDGLETLLSDDGTNISGGQKARIALARCYYHE